MTVEELEAIEIDWTQGVSENFQRVKSAALAAIEAANKLADEAEARNRFYAARHAQMVDDVLISKAAQAKCTDLCSRVAALEQALTSSEETKKAYMGEFSIPLPERDEDGTEYIRQVNVPWTTIKGIMFAIMAFADAIHKNEPQMTKNEERVVVEIIDAIYAANKLADDAKAQRNCYECGSEMKACAECNPELSSAALRARFDELEDKIDGLESELSSAVDVLFRRGDDEAREWIRMNYPKQYDVLKKEPGNDR